MTTQVGPATAGRSDVWLTPPHVLKDLGPFDLDPCAAPHPRPWDTAGDHYEQALDGLSLPWRGLCWVNPPYSACGPWLERLARHGRGIALVFARTDTDWWHRTVAGRASAMLFLRGRLRFCTRGGVPARSGVAPSVLVAYGAEACGRLERSKLRGQLVYPRRPEL